MKKIFLYSLLLLSFAATWSGCKEGSNYPGGQISPYLPIYDLRNVYKGQDVSLSPDNMFGSNKISGVVVSDHSGNNMPAGLLVIQERRRLNQLRGISLAIGADAAKYVPGDSVIVDVVGGILKRVDGILQITNITDAKVTKVSSGIVIPSNRVPSSSILNSPDKYESTLVAIVKGGFDPLPKPTDTYAGERIVNDGFEDLIMKTEANATFANTPLAISANFNGIIFNTPGTGDKLIPKLKVRRASDIQVLSSDVTIAPIVIAGFMADVIGGDGNYEYIQLLATQNINFAQTPYSVVTTNNAGASQPTGFPAQGWATGNMRTYKFNLTSGTVNKGEYFYVGGSTKLINGANSTNISSAKWIRSFNYSNTAGDGFGAATSGLFANSGNASGLAVFAGTNVTVTSTPVDVIMVGANGSIFTSASPARGYRIANTDWYDIINPITLSPQPFFLQGSNTISLRYNTGDLGYFNKLGGVYNPTLGRWVKARTQGALLLTKQSTLAEIEGTFPAAAGDDPGMPATTLK